MKIISGCQTGVDRAAIDVAIEIGLDYGGSVPRGRLAEDGAIDKKYDKLTELETDRYESRTEKNVVDTDATLIFTVGAPLGGTALTIECAKKHRKQYLLIDLEKKPDNEIIESIQTWLSDNQPEILNVAGPRESSAPGIYERVFIILYNIYDPLT
ncbi:MAG: putative molybdenum carrier protein [Proteobacteria bacterium]|nr:putative molybdenum carrier protein [Pseudomonadota bacterium]